MYLQNINSREEIIKVISNIIKTDNDKLLPVFRSELVDQGNKLTMVEVYDLLSTKKDLTNYPVEVLVWIYNVLMKYNSDLKPIAYYFTDKEIKDAEKYQISRVKAQYPLNFEILRKPDPNHEDYLMSIPIKTLVSLMENGVIQLDTEMQRENEISTYNGMLVSNIKFNPDAAREIGESMVKHNYRTDTIRLILVQDGEEDYDFKGSKLIVNSGNIALIDGNHRLKGSELALIKNENIELELVVIFSIGTVKDGQYIIAQSEKRQPLNSERLKAFENTSESSIVKGIKTSLDLDKVYKFVQTKEEVDKGVGFVLESILIDNVKKYYDVNGISKKQENIIKMWLVDFFNELADILNKDFANYLTVRKVRWSVSPYAFAGYLYASSKLYGKNNWQNQLQTVISKIDFEEVPWKQGARNQEKLAIMKFEEVVSVVLR